MREAVVIGYSYTALKYNRKWETEMTGRELKKLCQSHNVSVDDLVEILGLTPSYWNNIFLRQANLWYETELNIKLAIEVKKLRLKVKIYENQFQFVHSQEAKNKLKDDLAKVSIGHNVTDRSKPLG